MIKESYLGDGLYVSYDGVRFMLRMRRIDGDHCIYLEPSVLDEFLEYVRKQRSLELTEEKIIGEVQRGEHEE